MRQSAPNGRQIITIAAFLVSLCTIVIPSTFAWADGCTSDILKAEQDFGIPKGMLLAMSLVESGRSGKPNELALNLGGRSVYLKNADAAVKAMKDAKGNFKKNTMAGCMQLSLTHHKQSFHPITKIFDPKENVTYAARYLKRHYVAYGDWNGAIGRYNGGTKAGKQAYVCKIWRTMKDLSPESAALLDGSACTGKSIAAIAPETRQALARVTTVMADAGTLTRP